jgi:hypothetical protein
LIEVIGLIFSIHLLRKTPSLHEVLGKSFVPQTAVWANLWFGDYHGCRSQKYADRHGN